mgnify:CR=1 FL=1
MKNETKLKHTPAPWQLSTIDGEDCLMVGGGDDGSMIVADIRTDDPHDVVEANARLIAAAPDLLDALMHVVALLHATYDALDEYVAANDGMLRNPLGNKRVQDIADMATDALTKAIGETQE